MKRVFILILCAMLLCAPALAEMPYLTGLIEGTYFTSVDLPAGLYTFTLCDGETGMLTITLEDGFTARIYTCTDATSLTVYVPNRSTVKIEGAGILTEMEEAYVEWTEFSGTGRFLCGRQLPEDTQCSIHAMPGETAGYSVGSIRSDRGLAEETTVLLDGDAWQTIELQSGEFL